MPVAEMYEINKAAEPRFFEGTNGKAVLVIHGFTGYPGEFYEISEALNQEGYTVSLPLLPGHGRNRQAFKKTNWQDWLGHVKEEYIKLEQSHSSVSIVGLSMGGVLTLLLSEEFKPERIALLAPAMAIHSPVFYYTPILKFFIEEMNKEWTPEEGDSEDVRKLGEEYWKRNYIRQIAGLRKLQVMAKRKLKKVSAPALIMLSEIDDTVPVHAGDIIEKGLKNSIFKKIILKNSPHVIVSGPEKDFIINEVIQWIKEGNNND